MTSPFFIVGSGRSGTTMIRRLLSRHSLLCVPEETHFIPKMYKPFVRKFRRGKLKEAVNLLNELPLVKKWDVSISENELSGNIEKEYYASAISLLMNKKSQIEGMQFWGDKTPSYVFEIHFLSELYPDARFINIYRDGRDVALSVMPLSWGPNNAYASAVWYNRAIASWNDASDKISNPTLSICYEKFVQDPSFWLKEILDFIDIEWEDEILDGVEIQTDRTKKWKNPFFMSKRELSVFEYVAGDTLSSLGYECFYSNPHPNKLLLLFSIFDDYYKKLSNTLLRR